MAKKIFTLPWTMQELKTFVDGIVSTFSGGFLAWINRMRVRPFIIVDDDENKCKRVFLTQEDADTWFEARASGTMTQSIIDLEFTGNTIPGEEQYELRVSINNPKVYALRESTGNVIKFTFATVDKATNLAIGEAVDVYFTIENSRGTFQKPKVYTYKQGEVSQFLVDEYLAPGVNTITLMVRGRTTGLSRAASMTFEILNFSLSTTFDISKAISNLSDPLNVSYKCEGDYARTVHFAIDGREVASESISALETSPVKVKIFPNFGNTYGAGTHSIQIKASMSLDENIYWTNLLYREFEVVGEEHTTTLVSADFPPSQDFFNGTLPGFAGKQYVTQSLVWAFYSSEISTASVTWRLFAEDGTETTIGSRQADVVLGETDVMPEPVRFMPTEPGIFLLQALVKGEVIKTYDIAIEPNEELKEATDGLMCRLSGLGRSNSEEVEFRNDWSSVKNGIKTWCEFSEGFPFTAAAGYNNDGVEFYNGYTGIIKGYKPLAPQNASVASNGFAFGMKFRPYNMDDENAVIARIGDPNDNRAGIFIYPNRAVLRSSVGSIRDRVIRFKDEEDVDIYWIVYPNDKDKSEMPLFAFMQINGVRCFPRIYESSEDYNVGNANDNSNYGYLHLGDPNGKCGIRVYSIRMYNLYQGERLLQNNYIIDSGDISTKIRANDVYQKGGSEPDLQKLEERMPLIKLTGDLSTMLGSAGKPNLTNVGFELTHPDYYDHYAKCSLAELKKSGQSTQDRIGPMSMHIKFNKNKSNKLVDRNGKQYGKNRFPILPGYTPENSLRVLNNTLDSSCSNTGATLTLMNKIALNVVVDGKYVLRTPQQDYVLSGKYEEAMRAKYGKQFPKKEDWSFPYKLNFTPVAYSGVIVWRKDEDSPYQWLGCYTFIEEKKTDDSCGASSIRDKILEDGTFDPFNQYSGEKGEALVSNSGYLRFEIVTKGKYSMLQKGGELTFDSDVIEREAEIEKISEHDDETSEQYAQDWKEYGDEVIKRLCATEGNQAAFDAIIWDIFDIYSVAFYYIMMMILCNTDGSFRNMNQVRYQKGMKWRLVPWDWDMILGLLQDTYQLDAPPTADLYTQVDGTYIFNGMGYREPGKTGQDSYWFWDAILNNAEFKAMVPKMHAAMYVAGLKKKETIAAFDEFTKHFAPSIFNLDAQSKYINPYFQYSKNYLVSDMGDRTAFRHWFLDTNIDYFEQINGVGDFANNRTSTRAADADNAKIYCKAGATAVFGWTISGEEADPASSRTPKIPAGGEFTMTVNRKLTSKDILGVLSPHKLEVLDMHEFARFFSAELQFNACYNETTGTSYMKKLLLGMTLSDIKQYGPNLRKISSINGTTLMARLEEFDIRGQRGLDSNPDISGCKNLKKFYAGGSSLTAFNPADGSRFTEVELNDVVASIKATDVVLPEDGIRFIKTEQNHDVVEISCPTTLTRLELTGMGNDKGTHKLLHKWLMMLKADQENGGNLLSRAQLVCRNLEWEDATKDDVMTLARITMLRTVTGYIFCPGQPYTPEERAELIGTFGNNTFDYSARQQTLVCDCESMGVEVAFAGDAYKEDGVWHLMAGYEATLSAVAFPIKDDKSVIIGISGGQTIDNLVFYSTATLNLDTGKVTVDESSLSEYQINFYAFDGSNTTPIPLIIVPRTYPTSVRLQEVDIDGNEIISDKDPRQITSRGYKYFRAIFKVNGRENPEFKIGGFDSYGTLVDNGAIWEYTDNSNGMTVRCQNLAHHGVLGNNDYIFCLNIIDLPEYDVINTLNYSAKFKNSVTLKPSKPLKMLLYSIFKVIGNLPIAMGGNEALYKMLLDNGLEGTDDGFLTNEYMRNYTGDIFINDNEYDTSTGNKLYVTSLDTTAKNNKEQYVQRTMITKYFEHANKLDFSYSRLGENDEGINIDITNNVFLNEYDSSNSLNSITLGE